MLARRKTKRKKEANPDNLNLEVFDDHNIYSLHDLTKSGFEMAASDKDFKLSHEKLIKAVKVILYKVNLQ